MYMTENPLSSIVEPDIKTFRSCWLWKKLIHVYFLISTCWKNSILPFLAQICSQFCLFRLRVLPSCPQFTVHDKEIAKRLGQKGQTEECNPLFRSNDPRSFINQVLKFCRNFQYAWSLAFLNTLVVLVIFSFGATLFATRRVTGQSFIMTNHLFTDEFS